MYNQAILKYGGTLKFFPDCCKKKKCNQAVDNYAQALEFVSICHKTEKMCNEAPDTSLLLQYNWFSNVIRLKKCVLKLLILVLLYLILFLIDITLKKCLIKLFPKIFLF